MQICGVTDHELVAEARARRARPPAARDFVTASLLAALFVLSAIVLASDLPYNRALSVPSLLALVLGYAVVSRVDLEAGTGSAVPVQLVFVPMLFVLPLPVVPFAVAAGFVLGALPELLDGRTHPSYIPVLVARSWFSLGPVLVLSLVHVHGLSLESAPVYVWALATQLAFDAAAVFALERVAFGHSPELLLPSLGWIWTVETLLAPVGLVAAMNGRTALALVLPLAGLLDLIAHERRARIDRELQVGKAYRGALDEARRDELSGIGNRRRLMGDFERFSARGEEFVLVVYDLNGFKDYNDAFGHPAGDALLQRLAGRLSRAVDPAVGATYRLGGDEFCVLAWAGDDVEKLLASTIDALSETGEAFSITTCYGAVFVPTEAEGFSAALSLADSRLYSQKHLSRARRSRPHAFLLDALSVRDPDLHAHVHSVSTLAAAVGRELGLDATEVEEVRLAAELHDIGKLAIPEEVLRKPGPLSPTERLLMDQHTVVGQRLLGTMPSLQRIAAIVRATHERWDGSGYADGLAGEAIPLAARIIAVCDAFEAMISDRPYAEARTVGDALEELFRCAGSQFDPAVVDVFAGVLPTHDAFSVSAG